MSVFFCAEEKIKKNKIKKKQLIHFYFMTIQQNSIKRLFDLQTIKNHNGHKAIIPGVGDACALSGLCLLEF